MADIDRKNLQLRASSAGQKNKKGCTILACKKFAQLENVAACIRTKKLRGITGQPETQKGYSLLLISGIGF
jgi:hypothetical protein